MCGVRGSCHHCPLSQGRAFSDGGEVQGGSRVHTALKIEALFCVYWHPNRFPFFHEFFLSDSFFSVVYSVLPVHSFFRFLLKTAFLSAFSLLPSAFFLLPARCRSSAARVSPQRPGTPAPHPPARTASCQTDSDSLHLKSADPHIPDISRQKSAQCCRHH